MSTHRVDLARLEQTIDDLARFGTALEQMLDQADERVNRLHATWSGMAADEHRAVHAKWVNGAREMHAALAVMRQIAATAHGNYGEAAAANTRMWDL